MQTKMSPVYLPTIKLDGPTFEAITRGTFKLRVGQWIEKPDGTRGQYSATRHGAVYASWAGKGDSFDQRTQRFARHVWYSKEPSMDGRKAVAQAPRSVTMDTLKRRWNKGRAA